MRGFVFLEGVPAGDDQRLAVLAGARHGLADGAAFVGDHAAVEDHHTADEACFGVVGLDVFAQHGDALFEVVDGVTLLQQDAIDGDDAVGGKPRNEIGHLAFLSRFGLSTTANVRSGPRK